MTTLVIATRNAHKVQEVRAILAESFRYLTLNDFATAPAAVEDADTFAGNAAKKAVGLAQWLASQRDPGFHTPEGRAFVLADDSGLEVDALQGAPGVHSARFAALAADREAGSAATRNSPDTANNEKLLCLLKDVPPAQRTARFRCVLALVDVTSPSTPDAVRYFESVCEGHINFAPQGQKGFGYDPLFVPRGYQQSFAELGETVKNQLSHRAQALAKLRSWLFPPSGVA